MSSASTVSTFEKLVFWSLGYGGWMGIGMIPIILSLTRSHKVRAILMFLSAPMGALFMISLFSTVYLFTTFMREVFVVMSSPLFLHSCCSLMALAGVVFAFSASMCHMMYGNSRKVLPESSEESSEEEGSEETSEEEGSEEESEEGSEESSEEESEESSEEESSEEGSEEGSEESSEEEGSEEEESEEGSDDEDLNALVEEFNKNGTTFENVECSGKPTNADTTILRNASPLPDVDEEENEDEDEEEAS